jgi:hypothetical protein
MKQVTAVELLIQNIVEDQTIKAKSMSEWIMVFEKVKAMEKEQMVKFAEFVATYPDKNRNVYGQILHAKSKYDGAERTIDLLEEYYNETFKSE